VSVGVQLESTNARPLKVELILAETEHQMNDGSARWGDLHQIARLREEIGANSLWITDHLIHSSLVDACLPRLGGHHGRLV
jgi:hypothetical protein